MCGDKGASRPVAGESKAFLDIAGAPLFIHVLRGVEAAKGVGRIFIVGDKKRLDSDLLKYHRGETGKKPVVTLEQWGNLLANVWHGFLATIDGYEPGEEKSEKKLREKAVFLVSGDVPLLSFKEVDEFLDGADMEEKDYVTGLTPEETLKNYYPKDGKPGIRMSYFHLREGLFRVNNMHIAKPFIVANRGLIQLAYEARYQKKIRNILWFAWKLVAMRTTGRCLWIYFLMHTALTASRLGFTRVAESLRNRVSTSDLEKVIGSLLKLRMGSVITMSGGSALDVDNEQDYFAISEMFEKWKAMQTGGDKKVSH